MDKNIIRREIFKILNEQSDPFRRFNEPNTYQTPIINGNIISVNPLPNSKSVYLKLDNVVRNGEVLVNYGGVNNLELFDNDGNKVSLLNPGYYEMFYSNNTNSMLLLNSEPKSKIELLNYDILGETISEIYEAIDNVEAGEFTGVADNTISINKLSPQLRNTVNANSQDVIDIKGDIVSINSTISSLPTMDDLSILDGSIAESKLDNSIKLKLSKIATLEHELGNVGEELITIKSNLSNLETTVIIEDGSISSSKLDINLNTTINKVNIIDSELDSVKDDIVTINNNISNIQVGVSDNSVTRPKLHTTVRSELDKINNIEIEILDIKDDIYELPSRIELLDNSITENKLESSTRTKLNKVSTIESNLSSLQSTVSNHSVQTAKVPNLVSDVNIIKPKVTNLEDTVSSQGIQTAKVPNMESSISTLNNKVSNVESTLSSHSIQVNKIPDLESLTTALNLSVGGTLSKLDEVEVETNKIPTIQNNLSNLTDTVNNLNLTVPNGSITESKLEVHLKSKIDKIEILEQELENINITPVVSTYEVDAKNPGNNLFPIIADGIIDDTSRLQAIIDDVHSKGGGVILLPDSRISINEINLKQDVMLRGINGKTKLIYNNLSGIRMFGNSKVEHITFEGGGNAVVGAYTGALSIFNGEGQIINKCEFKNLHTGIYLNNSNYIKITNCRFHVDGEYGIYGEIQRGSLIDHNVFIGNVINNRPICNQFYAKHCKITNNLVLGNNLSITGILFMNHNNSPLASTHDNLITGNYVYGIIEEGISIDMNMQSPEHEVSWTGGLVTSSTINSITNVSANWDVDWTNKYVLITYGKGAGQYRIVSSHTSNKLTVSEDWKIVPDNTSGYIIGNFGFNNTITNNNTLDCGRHGIILYGTNISSTIDANTVVNCGINTDTTVYEWGGIGIVPCEANEVRRFRPTILNTVTNNNISGGKHGIVLCSAPWSGNYNPLMRVSNSLVTGNIIKDCKVSGMYVTEAEDVIIKDNIIKNVSKTIYIGANTNRLTLGNNILESPYENLGSGNIISSALESSPNLTGVPTAPTAPIGTNNNQIATTAFVLANSGSGGVIGTITADKVLVSGGGELVPSETNITFTLRNGYMNSSDGVYMNGTNWRTVEPFIDNPGATKYKFKHPNTSRTQPQIRVLGANTSNQIAYNQIVSVNSEFNVPSNVILFGFNAVLPNATPATNNVPFTDVEDLNQLTLVSISGSSVAPSEDISLDLKLEQIDIAISDITGNPLITNNSLKVLMIGNSFSEDVSAYIHNICASARVNVVFGNLYRPGESLEGHWNQISTGGKYDYHRRTSNGGTVNHTTNTNVSLLQALQDELWDVVVYQQSSPLSGVSTSFSPYLANLINYVNNNSNNSNVKHALHMTWAYASNSNQPGFSNYNNNQTTMYNAIVDAYQKAMRDNNLDIIIPTGTSIQNARTISYLHDLNNELTDDSYHLGIYGDYIGGLTLFKVLVATKYKKDLFEDVQVSIDNDKYLSYLCKLAVNNAIINPFNVTDI